MIMKVSKRAQAVPPSATLAVTARAKELKAQGINVIGFGAGEPDFDTPKYIKDAAIAALNAGKTKYTPASGTIELKKAIAEKLLRENKLEYKPEQIVVNIGAKHSVYGAMQAVLDPGDAVILPTPYLAHVSRSYQIGRGKGESRQNQPPEQLQDYSRTAEKGHQPQNQNVRPQFPQ